MELQNIVNKLESEVDKFNQIYQSFYHFNLLEQNNRIYVVDEFEEFYYDGQDFDNCLEDITSSFRKIIKDKELYLDCDCPGRWEIVSDELEKLLNKEKGYDM